MTEPQGARKANPERLPIGHALAGPLAHYFGTDRVLVACAVVLFGAASFPLLLRGTTTLTRRTGEAELVPA